MIPAHFASALANHLWQSTVFAGAAGLLALALRKNHAQARYWLWLIASLKFLVPFSLFVGLGSQIGSTAPRIAPTQLVFAEEIGQPFTTLSASLPAAPATHPLPLILFAIWFCGFLAIAICWLRRWQQMRATLRAARPLPIEAPTKVLSSPVLIEPGIFGIRRPVLLLPEGITEHLTSAQLQAILAHELCHVRRRDNLHAALHMLVEALFWFHPLIWWIGSRLIEERERACDEEVLRLGNEPEIYAESILRTCQFYLESPLPCVSGITGSDLKKRVVRIMTQGLSYKLDSGKKLLLAAAAITAIAGPVAFGLLNAPQTHAQSAQSEPASAPAFEVVSIKPNKSTDNRRMMMNSPGMFQATGVTLHELIRLAYEVQDRQITGGPSWLNSDRFDIEAKLLDGGDMRTMNQDQRQAEMDRRRLMLQAMLADRFQLKINRETKDLPIYALVVAKNGPKLKQVQQPVMPPEGARRGAGQLRMGRGELSGQAVSISFLAQGLSNQLDRPVIDQTGLKGAYDFTIQWTPDIQGPTPNGPSDAVPDSAPPPDSSGPSIFTVIQEQLGLKLEATKGPVEVLVIDHAEKPSEN